MHPCESSLGIHASNGAALDYLWSELRRSVLRTLQPSWRFRGFALPDFVFDGVQHLGSGARMPRTAVCSCARKRRSLPRCMKIDQNARIRQLCSRRSRFAPGHGRERPRHFRKSGYCSGPRIIARRRSLQPSPSASRPQLPCFLRQHPIVGQTNPWMQCRRTSARPWPAIAQADSSSVQHSRRLDSALRYCGPTLIVD